jgi:N-methylhydantoinase A/oxoprolinase/acetone carboxylase beta subunit
VASWPVPGDHTGIDTALAGLAGAAVAQAGEDAEVITSLDCRYTGQSHELRVPTVADFDAEHERRNGYGRPGTPVEVIALRATATVASPVSAPDLPLSASRAAGGATAGPAVVAEPDCTIWIPEGWEATPGQAGALLLRRVGPSGRGSGEI